MTRSVSSLADRLAQDLELLAHGGLQRALRPHHQRRGPLLDHADGVLIDFASNDYLGLAGDPRIAEAARRAFEEDDLGAPAARLISGDHAHHHRLEGRIAQLKGTQAALLFPSGYAANIGGIPALARRGDVIYADALNHASLIDGCRLARAETRTFPHADLDALRGMLQADRGAFRQRWILVDGVFSMDGDVFPLRELVALAREHEAWTWVDDAHGTGVLGPSGAGSAEAAGVAGDIDVMMGTLGKAFGVLGGFVAGSEALRTWLLNRARAFVFTTATPPHLAAASCAALDIAASEPWRRDRVRALATRVRAHVEARGHALPGPTDGHIIPIVLGSADATMQAGAALRDRGVHVGAVRPPTVPLGSARLRITVSAGHTDAQVDHLLGALDDVLPTPLQRSPDE